MANYLTTDTELTSVANAIRTKGGTSAQLSFPSGFVSAIQNIPTGGGSVDEDADVLFIDYDGTPVAGKSKSEINAMTSDSDLPANPTHTGLTAQGWNWTVAQLKEQLLAMPNTQVIVGQMYVTTSGATEIDVDMVDGRLNPTMAISVNGTVTIDWGDETTPDTVNGTSLTTQLDIGHTYAVAGEYTIQIKETTGSRYAFELRSSNIYLLYKYGYANSNEGKVYSNSIKKIRLGGGITSIGSYAFAYLTSLESVSIHKDITTINKYCFNTAHKIKAIVLPKGLNIIQQCAIRYTYALKYLSLPYSITEIKQSAFNYLYMRKINLTKNITVLDSFAFEACYDLSKIELPPNLVSIGNSAFNNCYSIAKLIIPASVNAIGNSTFSNCYGMKEYHFKSTTPPTAGTTIFSNIRTDTIIYVPYSEDHSILNTYKTANNWSDYASYIQEEPQ